MLQIQCVRCHKPAPQKEMLNLGSIDEKGGRLLYSCEGCLLSFEQDRFYKQYVYKLPEPENFMQMAA